jgi:hypothetical protein
VLWGDTNVSEVHALASSGTLAVYQNTPWCHNPEKLNLNFTGCFVWCETRSPTLREEHRLRVFEKGVLRREYGSRRGEMVVGWRRVHCEELCNFYASLNVMRVIKSRRTRCGGGHVGHMREMRCAYKILVGNLEGGDPLLPR